MDQSCPRHEVRRIFQQLLRADCSIIKLFNIIGVYFFSFLPVIFLCDRNFAQRFSLTWSLFRSLNHNNVATLDLKFLFFLLDKVNSAHHFDYGYLTNPR